MAFFNKTNADIGNTLWGRFQVGLLFMIMLLQPFKSLHGFYDGLLIISLVIIGISIYTKQFKLPSKTFLILLGIYTFSILISTIISVDIKESLDGIRSELLKQLIVFIIILVPMASAVQKRNGVLWGFMLSGVIMNTIGLFPYFLGCLASKDNRLVSFSESYTRLAYFYVYLVPFLVLLIPREKKWKTASVYILLILSLLATLLTKTRGGWICIPLAAFIACLITLRWKELLSLILIILIGGVLIFSISPSLRSRASDFQEVKDWSGSFGLRKGTWQSATNTIKKRPIFGAGYGKYIFRKVYELNPVEGSEPYCDTHNTYLEILTQRGVFGFFVTLALYLYFLKITFFVSQTHSEWGSALFAYFIAISVAFAIFSLVDNIYVKETGRYLWQMAALSMVFFNDAASKENCKK